MVKFITLLAVLLSLPCAAQLTTTDSSLNTGSSTSGTYTAPGSSGPNTVVHPTGQPTKNLWLLYPDPFGVSTGSGTIVQTYTGSGTITEAISLSGIPTSGVESVRSLMREVSRESRAFSWADWAGVGAGVWIVGVLIFKAFSDSRVMKRNRRNKSLRERE